MDSQCQDKGILPAQKFQNLNILHLFAALVQEAYFPKGIKGEGMGCA